MRPNTPHVVFTPEHSVCRGGHFYATPTLRDTCYGLIHTFTAGAWVTNASHTKEAFLCLSYIAAFFQRSFMEQSTDGDMVDPGAGKSCSIQWYLQSFV
jgi:hypothetical protein